MDPTQSNDSFGSLSAGGGGPVAGGAVAAGGVPADNGVAATNDMSAGGAMVDAYAPTTITSVDSGDTAAPATGTAPVTGTAPTTGTAPISGASPIAGGMPVAGGAGSGGVAGMGQPSANLGQPSANLGQPSANLGQPSANLGQTNPYFGQANTNFSQTNANMGQANAIFGQGNTFNTVPMQSARGDVIIGGEAKRSSKKGLVVGGVIALVVLIVVGLVVGFTFGKKGGIAGGGQVDPTTKRSAFNSYANYVMFGEDSNEDLTEEEISNFAVYFQTFEPTEEALAEYTAKANEKFNDLENGYPNDIYRQFAFPALSDYFQKYPNAQLITVQEISELFSRGGRSGVEALIDSKYSVNDEGITDDYRYYLDIVRSLSMYQLDVIEKARAAGCVLSVSLEGGCYVMNDDELQAMHDRYKEYYDMVGTVGQNAYYSLQDLYNRVYGLVEEDEGEDTGNSQADEGEAEDEEDEE